MMMNEEIQTIKSDAFRSNDLEHYSKGFALINSGNEVADCSSLRTDYYGLELCVQGKCVKNIGSFEFEMSSGTLHLITPRHTNSYQRASEDLILFQVLFTKEFLITNCISEADFDHLTEINPEVPPFFELSEEKFRSIQHIFFQIKSEQEQSGAFYLQISKLLTVQLLYEMNRACETCLMHSNRYLSRQFQLVQQFKRMVDTHFIDLRTVQEYADRLNVSSKYLSVLTKEATGQSALTVIHNRLYREAKHLLTSSTHSIKEITNTLRFDTGSHFTRFFKQHAGITPSSLRVSVCQV